MSAHDTTPSVTTIPRSKSSSQGNGPFDRVTARRNLRLQVGFIPGQTTRVSSSRTPTRLSNCDKHIHRNQTNHGQKELIQASSSYRDHQPHLNIPIQKDMKLLSVCIGDLGPIRAGGRKSRPERKMDQLGHGAKAQFCHEVSSMFLDRFFGRSQFRSNHFVQLAGDYKTQNFLLARCQAIEQGLRSQPLVTQEQKLCGAEKTLLHGLKKFVVLQRFRQKIDRAAFEGMCTHGNVAEAGDKDDLLRSAVLGKYRLKIEPA
jgi:hypothetical protein